MVATNKNGPIKALGTSGQPAWLEARGLRAWRNNSEAQKPPRCAGKSGKTIGNCPKILDKVIENP